MTGTSTHPGRLVDLDDQSQGSSMQFKRQVNWLPCSLPSTGNCFINKIEYGECFGL